MCKYDLRRKCSVGSLMVVVFLLLITKVALAQNDSSRTSSFAGFPIAFYTPETSLAFGGGGLWTIRKDTIDGLLRQTSLQGYVVYTLEDQLLFQLPFQLFPKNFYLRGEIDYFKFPFRFYGLGDTVTTDDFEWYDTRFSRIGVDVYRRIGRGLYAGPKAWMDDFITVEPEEGSTLARNRPLGAEPGTSFGIGLGLLLDRRNDLYYTSKGTYIELTLLDHNSAWSDFVFTKVQADVRQYFSISEKHRSVLSFQALGVLVNGGAPFNQLAQAGGQRYLRGYYQGQYSDRRLVSAQAEYKQFVLPRWGFALFAGAGTTWGITEPTFLPAAGVGLRFVLDRKQRINVRIDQAFGRNSSGIYFTVLEAF